MLRRVQNDLFDVGADLCTPLRRDLRAPAAAGRATAWVDELEADCDHYNERAGEAALVHPPRRHARARRYLHVARTVVRRAERSTWAALERYGDQPARTSAGGVNPLTAKYLNRLSDLLFILARVANLAVGGDVLWQPGGGARAAARRSRRGPRDAAEAPGGPRRR